MNAPFISVGEINEFLKNYSLTRHGFDKASDSFTDLIKELEFQQIQYEDLEKEAYNLFQVDDLPSLQRKIDALNNSGLIELSSKCLQEAKPFFDKISDDSIDIERIFLNYVNQNKEIAEALKKRITEKGIVRVTDLIYNMIGDEINKQRMKRASEKEIAAQSVSENKFKAQIADLIKYNYTKKKNNKAKFSRTYRKDLIILLKEKGEINNSTWEYELSTSGQELEDIITEDNFLNRIDYYPYFSLSESEKQEALNGVVGKQKWQLFKEHLLSLVNTEESKKFLNMALDQLGVSFFIRNSTSDVIGALGELQALTIILYLTNNSDVSVLATGLEKNIKNNNRELGADILLNETVGIQVKNYRGYGKGYHLKKSFSVNYFIEKMNDNANAKSLGEYLSICCYNQPVSWANEQYINLYNWLTGKTNTPNVMMNTFLATNIDQFLTFSELYEINLNDAHQLIDGMYANAFYLMGGKDIVPVSYIIRLLIDRLYKFKKYLSGEGTGNDMYRNFSSSYTYSGTKKWNNLVEEGKEKAPSFDELMQKINLSISLNMYLPDLKLHSGGPIIHK